MESVFPVRFAASAITCPALIVTPIGFSVRTWTPASMQSTVKPDRKSTRLNSSHQIISYAVFHHHLHSFPTRRSSDLQFRFVEYPMNGALSRLATVRNSNGKCFPRPFCSISHYLSCFDSDPDRLFG